jgi:hypothetical protein
MVKLEPTEIIYSMHRLGTLKLAIIIWAQTRHTGSNRHYLGTKEAQYDQLTFLGAVCILADIDQFILVCFDTKFKKKCTIFGVITWFTFNLEKLHSFYLLITRLTSQDHNL